MGSRALASWAGDRRGRISELYAAHAAVGGTGRGRRTATQQLNWALALRLAGEFQGFARDLHDEVIRALDVASYATPAFRTVLQSTFTLGRQLDRGNATPSTLQQDFLRVGIPLVDSVKSAYARGAAWLAALEKLNDARNGIAHSDPAKLARAIGPARGLRLAQVKAWDAAVNQLARAMDRVTADELVVLTGGSRPW